jgi:plasmid stabilization system protein ParE
VADRRYRLKVDVTEPARRDIREILTWTERESGKNAALCYEVPLKQALRDIGSDPAREDSRDMPGIVTAKSAPTISGSAGTGPEKKAQ